jgi:hypothetical protein
VVRGVSAVVLRACEAIRSSPRKRRESGDPAIALDSRLRENERNEGSMVRGAKERAHHDVTLNMPMIQRRRDRLKMNKVLKVLKMIMVLRLITLTATSGSQASLGL